MHEQQTQNARSPIVLQKVLRSQRMCQLYTSSSLLECRSVHNQVVWKIRRLCQICVICVDGLLPCIIKQSERLAAVSATDDSA